jgi:hypothetical protein
MRYVSIGARGPGRRAAGISLGILAGMVLAGGRAAAADPSAAAAATMALNEKGQLHKTSTGGRGLTLNEVGSASGTIKGAIYIHLSVGSPTHVTAEVNIYPSGGSLTGYASASYRVVGAYADFTGTMSVAKGTGRYAHAHASGLRFAGAIKRVDDTISVEVSGKLSY